MAENLLAQLSNLRQLFSDAAPDDPEVITDYAWTIVKALLQHTTELDSRTSRQLLADCLKLPVQRPSKLYSTILSAAVKVSSIYPDFRFAAFLKLWGIENLRSEDHQRQQPSSSSVFLSSQVPSSSAFLPSQVSSSSASSSSQASSSSASPSSQVSSSSASSSSQVSSSFPAGKSFPSLVEKATRALAHSLLLHPEDEMTAELIPLLQSVGYHTISSPLMGDGKESLIHPMLVTRIKQAAGKDGRKYTFVTLTSPEGLEIETISHTLQPSPLHPLPEGKRHYVNIGQLYDCLLRTKPSQPIASSSLAAPVPSSLPTESSLTFAYLSQSAPATVFPTEIGYIDSVDQQHSHMHVYDSYSRHFAAPILRFSKEKEGDFVRFIPIIPSTSKFKTAIILTTVPSSSLPSTVPSSSLPSTVPSSSLPAPVPSSSLPATVPSSSLPATVPSSSLPAPVPSDLSEGQSPLRSIRITSVNKEKCYAAWELTDKARPITECLSPLQLSLGETSPSFTTGYLPLTPEGLPQVSTHSVAFTSQVSSSCAAGAILPGQTLCAFIYLKRGKDRQKRPHIACLFV